MPSGCLLRCECVHAAGVPRLYQRHSVRYQLFVPTNMIIFPNAKIINKYFFPGWQLCAGRCVLGAGRLPLADGRGAYCVASVCTMRLCRYTIVLTHSVCVYVLVCVYICVWSVHVLFGICSHRHAALIII